MCDQKKFIDRVKSGYVDEELDLILFIMEILLLPEQAVWMFEQHLQISDLLNGRFNSEQEPTVEAIFKDWNMRIGTTLFSLRGYND